MVFKHMKTLGWTAIAISALVFLVYPTAAALPPGGNQEEGMEMKPHFMPPFHLSPCAIWQDREMVEGLGLTGEQIEALRDADLGFREKHLELKARLQCLHFEMEKAFSSEILEEETVREAARKIAALEAQLSIQFIDSLLAREKILTRGQRKKQQNFGWTPRNEDQRQKPRPALPREKERPRK